MKKSLLLLPAAVCALVLTLSVNAAHQKKSHDLALQHNLETFNAIVKTLDESYVDSLRVDDAFDAAIGMMLSTVDPYTEYYSEKDRDKLMRMTTGEYAGIGSYIQVRDGITYISQPLEGSPAQKIGLRAGDKILQVDSIDVVTKKGQDVSSLLRGQPGTNVKVKVMRPFVTDSILDFEITRERVSEPSVPYYGIYDGNIGYIKLTSFIDKSPKDIREALDSFKNSGKVDRVVLDLRGNGGGLVESAVDILANFLPKGTEVLRTKGKELNSEKIYRTTRQPVMPDMPLIVLIDGGSASASEITAGALQDLDRAVLVGTRSFGKGLVQTTSMLPYDGLLKLTVAKYYMPSGRLIQALDYSHRNADGSVARTPDSLTHVFKTLHGREVRDGGGLTPDSTVTWGKVNHLLYQLLADNKIFDYATKYVATHPAPASPDDVKVTDEMFEEFEASLDSASFKYNNGMKDILKGLRDNMEMEGFASDEITAQVDSLEKMVKENLSRDLANNRRDVTDYLEEEIAVRYFGEKGKLRKQLERDPGMVKAKEIFSNGDYRKILDSGKGAKKK